VAGETFGADAGAGGVEGAVEGAGCEGVDFEAEIGGEGEEGWGGGGGTFCCWVGLHFFFRCFWVGCTVGKVFAN